jgi:hypothetical protein
MIKQPKSDTYIPLQKAYLCQDCSCVGDNARQCPACASKVVVSLAGILNREEVAA